MKLQWHLDRPPYVWSDDVDVVKQFGDAYRSADARRLLAVKLVAVTNGGRDSPFADVKLDDGSVLRVNLLDFVSSSPLTGG